MQQQLYTKLYVENNIHFKCNLLHRAHSHEQTTFTRVSLSGSHQSSELTETMRLKHYAKHIDTAEN